MKGTARALLASCLFLVIFGLAAGNGAGLTPAAAFQAELDSLRHEYGLPGGSEVIGKMERRLAGVAIAFAEKSVAPIGK